jgi:hypothetical protein
MGSIHKNQAALNSATKSYMSPRKVGAAEFHRLAVRQEAQALDAQAGIAFLRLQQSRLLGVQQQGRQPLQGAHRALAGRFQRFVHRGVDRIQRGQGEAAMVAYSRHIGMSSA